MTSVKLPLHYHVSDATGHTVEVSFKEGEVVIKDNPIGVLTCIQT